MTTSAECLGRGGMFNKDEEDKKMNRHSLNGCKTSKNGGGAHCFGSCVGRVDCLPRVGAHCDGRILRS